MVIREINDEIIFESLRFFVDIIGKDIPERCHQHNPDKRPQ